MRSIREVYFNRRLMLLLPLAFASGLPFVLTAGTLQAWMSSAGVNLKDIGLFSLVTLPYSLKFLWAPLMDRYIPPLLGRRRGWLLMTQLLIVPAIIAMALAGPTHMNWLAGAALALAFASASQDIVGDAYRADLLPPEERGSGAAVWVMAWRVGFAASGVATLYCVGRFGISWQAAYCAMAVLMGVGIVGSIVAPEPTGVAAAPRTLAEAVWHPLRAFLLKPEGWLVVTFILVFKIPEFLADTMTIPFLQSIGVKPETIGLVRQGFGTIILLVGTTVGGAMVARLPLRKCLLICGVLHGVSNLSYLLLVFVGPRLDALCMVVAIEYFIIGLTTTAFVAFLMGHCDSRFSATQYALLSGAMALSRTLVGAPSGWIAQRVGWGPYFLVSMATMAPGLLLLPWVSMARKIDPADLPIELMEGNP
jgi:PAT family beta-lactamase induction signal transducer AmpG